MASVSAPFLFVCHNIWYKYKNSTQDMFFHKVAASACSFSNHHSLIISGISSHCGVPVEAQGELRAVISQQPF